MTNDDNTDEVRLYILMRTDMASLNPGKACAQASHAANQCVNEILSKSGDRELLSLLRRWERDTGHGFGTCIVLDVNESAMRGIVHLAVEKGLHANIVNDPTYPIVDGATVHKLSVDTCGFVFGPKSKADPILQHFPLMS